MLFWACFFIVLDQANIKHWQFRHLTRDTMLVIFSLQSHETERQRLVNLRDRASEKGRKKEYPTTQCSFLTVFFCLLTAVVVSVLVMHIVSFVDGNKVITFQILWSS